MDESLVCEVEYLECDRHSTDAATDPNGLTPVIDEVAEQPAHAPRLFRCKTDSRLPAQPRNGQDWAV